MWGCWRKGREFCGVWHTSEEIRCDRMSYGALQTEEVT